MSDGLIDHLLAMAEHRQLCSQGEYLFHRDDPVDWIYVIAQGRVELVRPQPDGTALALQRAGPGALFAEASLYSGTYHCDGIAAVNSVAAAISKPVLLSRLREESDLSHLWSSHLATQMQKARYRAEVLSCKTVAGRLDAWLNLHDGAMPPKGEWKHVAAEIGVSPEAFYRELARRR